MLSSANAAAEAGPPIQLYDRLPCYCVGEATASAAHAAGIDRTRTGTSDAGALLAQMAEDGVRSVLHLCGREHMPAEHPSLRIERRAVYAAEPIAALEQSAVEALSADAGALALIHSPRAGRHFGELVDRAGLSRAAIGVAAISPNAAAAVGGGWHRIDAPALPRDEALLELAAKLCKTAPRSGTGLGG
jgi:uroporphyrinogen-III synthase